MPMDGTFSPSPVTPADQPLAARRIGLVAHDHRKPDLIEWALHDRQILARHLLVATGTTGTMLEEALGVGIEKLHSGPLGGDLQLGAQVAEGSVDVLIFFWDPLEAQPHDPDVRALLRVAVVWNVPVACNRATADLLITSPLLEGPYRRAIPDHAAHLRRRLR